MQELKVFQRISHQNHSQIKLPITELYFADINPQTKPENFTTQP